MIDDGGLADRDRMAREDPIDANSVARRGLVAVKSVKAFVMTSRGGSPGVGEPGARSQFGVGRAVTGGTVEIAEQQQRQGGIGGGNTPAHERGGFYPGQLDLVVEVGVPDLEFTTGGTVAETPPSDHAPARVAPSG